MELTEEDARRQIIDGLVAVGLAKRTAKLIRFPVNSETPAKDTQPSAL